MSLADLPFSPACERNKRPIWEVLAQVLPQAGIVLEIGSGTGQHVVYFASEREQLQWQPTDRPEYLPGLRQRLEREGRDNIRPPLILDVLEPWPGQVFDAVYSSNTAHIMSWPAVCAMFTGIGPRLENGGVFCLYGPFNENGEFTAPSNAAFDAQLRAQDPQMGLRDIADIESLAVGQHMRLTGQFQLPANNRILLFQKYLGAMTQTRRLASQQSPAAVIK